VDYQAIFDRVFPTFEDEEKYGRYAQLVNTLEAVFKAAGYDVPGAELSWDHHNQIVGAVGQTNLADIARSFIGWMILPKDDYRTRSVAIGYIPHGYRDSVYHVPEIQADILKGWGEDIKQLRQKRGIKGRKSPAYRAFIAGIAATPTVRETMLKVAQGLLDERDRRRAALKAEVEAENAKALTEAAGSAKSLRRKADIVDAFVVISGVADTEGKAAALREWAAQIERGAAARQQVVEFNDDLRAVDLVAAAMATVPKQVELTGVWRLIYLDMLLEHINTIYAANGHRFNALPVIQADPYVFIPLVYGDGEHTPVDPETLTQHANQRRYTEYTRSPQFQEEGNPAEATDALWFHGQGVSYLIKLNGGVFNPWRDAAAFMVELVEAGY